MNKLISLIIMAAMLCCCISALAEAPATIGSKTGAIAAATAFETVEIEAAAEETDSEEYTKADGLSTPAAQVWDEIVVIHTDYMAAVVGDYVSAAPYTISYTDYNIADGMFNAYNDDPSVYFAVFHDGTAINQIVVCASADTPIVNATHYAISMSVLPMSFLSEDEMYNAMLVMKTEIENMYNTSGDYEGEYISIVDGMYLNCYSYGGTYFIDLVFSQPITPDYVTYVYDNFY